MATLNFRASHRTAPDAPTTRTHLLTALKDPANNRAWNEFENRYRPIIERLARRRGLSREDAAEASQLTMLAFFKAHRDGRFDRSMGRLRAFLLTVAGAKIVDVQRANGRANRLGGGSGIHACPAPSAAQRVCTTLAVFANGPQEILRESARVSEQTIRLFELTVLHGVPPTAAAAMCGVTEDAVYVAKHRALRHLRALAVARSGDH